MAITNLTNTKWKFNELINVHGISSFDINFTSNNKHYVGLANESPDLYYYLLDDGDYAFDYSENTWYDQAYRTIEITGGDDVTNSDLIAFLTANAVQITAPSFTRTKAAIKIYEDLTQEEYDALTKEPHSFYLVNGVGIYKGTTLISAGANSSMDEIVEELNQAIAAKQDTLVSGTNIKTINGESILGEGNIEVAASDDGVDTAYVENEVLYIDDDTSAGSKVVVDLEEVPSIVDETSPDLINVNGVVYYKKLLQKDDITNLTNTTWYFNETINFYDVDIDHLELDYISNKKTYSDITAMAYSMDILYSPDDTGSQYYEGKWINEEYRTIEIIGGLYAEDIDIIGFLQVNATLTSIIYLYEKLSWTKEEIKDTYVLKLDDYISSEDYSKYNYTKEEIDNIVKYEKIIVRDTGDKEIIFYKTNNFYENDTSNKLYIVEYTSIEDNIIRKLAVGYDEGSPYYIKISIKYCIENNQFEDLVGTTPTDVSIIDDEGKLKLQLEHDGEVLAVNDTPNQFLQRSLKTPSAAWQLVNSSGDVTSLLTWLNDLNAYKGQIVYLKLGIQHIYGIIDYASTTYYDISPLSIHINADNIDGRQLITCIRIREDSITVEGHEMSTGQFLPVSYDYSTIGDLYLF